MKSISRRNFLINSFLLYPGINLLGIHPGLYQQANIMDKLGLQLACIMDQLVSQPQQTLEFIYSLGIRHIEFSDISLLKRLHPVMRGMGFKVQSSYFASPYITGNWQPYIAFGNQKPKIETFASLLEEASTYNLKYLVLPEVFPQDRGGLEWYRSFSEQLNKAGELCKKVGIQLCYKNHNYEFQPVENTSPMDVMLNTLDPDLVKLELDIAYMSVADINITDFVNSYHHQIALLQLNDLSVDATKSYRGITLPPSTFQPLGQGIIDFIPIFNAKAIIDLPYYFINLEQSVNVLEDLKSSVAYLKTL